MIIFTISRLLAVFLCLNFAHADTSIKFGGWSKHLSDGDYNSFHRIGFVQHNDYFGAYFRNSFDDDSFAIGKTWSKQDSVFRFSLHGGLTYGYRQSSSCYKKQDDRERDPKIICPMLAPEVMAHRLTLKPSLALFGLDAVVLTFNYGL
jgi:hypothetical protein